MLSLRISSGVEWGSLGVAGWDSELLVTLRQDGVLLLGHMCAHLLTCGHHFAFDATYGTYVPTGEDSIGRMYTCIHDFAGKIRGDMLRLEIWDSVACVLVGWSGGRFGLCYVLGQGLLSGACIKDL